jgi:hypothetical protein
MNYLWDQLLKLDCSAGTAEVLNGLVSTGVVALSVVGIIVIAVGIVWQIPQAWKQVRAEKREKHQAGSVDSNPE